MVYGLQTCDPKVGDEGAGDEGEEEVGERDADYEQRQSNIP